MKKLILMCIFFTGAGVQAMNTEQKCMRAAYFAVAVSQAVPQLNKDFLEACGTPHDRTSPVDALSEVIAINAAIYGVTATIIADDIKPGLAGIAIAATCIAGNAAYKKAKQTGQCAIQ
ncbi:MAG TPA: hypothetical protein VLG50_01800 [Candidatus Saccharimonadales bacterium]|nr:hypothetical protein [Candidatus Saccharimonadales bacterium]